MKATFYCLLFCLTLHNCWGQDDSLRFNLLENTTQQPLVHKLSNEAQKIRQEILDHGAMIRAAFADGNVDLIRQLHHPQVEKALNYGDSQIGRKVVVEGIESTLAAYHLKFIENDVESILVQGDLAIEQTLFTIQGSPKAGGDSFLFKGRTLVTYVRSEESPSGWATIREIIQPAN